MFSSLLYLPNSDFNTFSSEIHYV